MTPLNVALAGSVTLSHGLERTEPLSPPDIESLRDLVVRLVGEGTGEQAIHEASTEASCIARVWSAAATFEHERDWRLLLDDATDTLEARGYATPSDLTFLANTMTAPRTEIVTAVRLLGAIGEDGLAPIEGVRALLTDFLAHRDPAVRIATAEAVWQMADRQAAPILAAALEREEHPAVRDTLAHVLHLFA